MKVNGLVVPGVFKIDNARVYGLEESIIASAYPMLTDAVDMENVGEEGWEWLVSEKDDKRAKHLGNAVHGSGHDCFLKGIIIQFDMQVPEYIWRQWDRYHFNDYISSQSKMHKILKLDINEVCNKYVTEEIIDLVKYWINIYNNYEKHDGDVILLRDGEEIAFTKENIFRIIVSNCPVGLMLTARVTLNYLQAKSMKLQRKNHKMDEWHYICDFFDSLPRFKELTSK